MTHDEMIAVIEHHKKGGLLESRVRCRPGRWSPVSIPVWDFDCFEYRPKREPVVLWGVVWQSGDVSNAHFKTREVAEEYAERLSPGRVFKMVEVVE